MQVLSTPYDPEYGKFTGAVSNVETRPGDFNKFRMSAQNLLPRLRRLDGSIMGTAAVSPRITFSAPIVKDGLFVGVHDYLDSRFVRGEQLRFSLSAQTSDDSFHTFVLLRECSHVIRDAGIKRRDDRYLFYNASRIRTAQVVKSGHESFDYVTVGRTQAHAPNLWNFRQMT